MSVVRPVILSGGAGTRLWPLSTRERPKQFVELIPGRPPLFDEALTRLNGLPDLGSHLIVTGGDHLTLVEEALARTGMEDVTILVEPQGRNTAPAAIAAALAAEPEDCLVLLPSDHLIADGEAFRAHVAQAVAEAADGVIVTFGIVPIRPETGYGYIEAGEARGSARQVVRFKEKPPRDEAERMASDGAHYWNSGMFVLTAATLLGWAGELRPEVLNAVREAMPVDKAGLLRLGDGFSRVESISFDHAIMEKVTGAVVIPTSVGWDDIGSYHALWAVTDKDPNGNVVSGPVALSGVTNSYVRSTARPMAVADMDRVVAVETPEGVLVVPLDSSQQVRDLADRVSPG